MEQSRKNIHKTGIHILIDGVEAGHHFSKFGKMVEISRGESVKFLGFIVDKSIIIPLSSGKDSDDDLALIAGANMEVIRTNTKDTSHEASCHLLGLPYNGQTLGLYSDGQNFGQIDAIHIHPETHMESQEEFVDFAREALTSVGSTLTIIED